MIGVCIVTYNQEKYIAQAIESVLTQVNCGHQVVVYVGDDHSTDRTRTICDEYARRLEKGKFGNENWKDKMLKVIHNKKNLGLVGNTMNLLDIIRKDGCEYIAMLDGDDYWCDERKLQKQMIYMNTHPKFGLVHTCVDWLYPNRCVRDERVSEKEGDVSSVIFNYNIGNCSVIFKTELLNHINFEEFQCQGLMSCDYIMYIIFSCYTYFGFIPDHTAVWRMGHDSVSHTNDMEKQLRYLQNDVAMWRYSAKLFPDKWTADEKEIEKYIHERSFVIAFRYGDRKRALVESKRMSTEDRRKNRWKIFAAHSAILTMIWRHYKHMD